MSLGLPIAIINGIGRFGAKNMAELLVKNDIMVIGVGEFAAELEYLNNFEFQTELNEVTEKADYVFDFEENSELWERAERDGAKLTIVGVNKEIDPKKIPSQIKANWRIVNVHGVYGPGMEKEDEEIKEIEFLIKAVRLAVINKNLVLPRRNQELRLLAVEDLTEVVMRASFLSGMEGEVVEIWGRLTNSEEVASVLMEEAKMTRYKVVEEEMSIKQPEEEVVAINWKKLRWQPKVVLKEGMKETMQYYFSKADEESRKKKDQKLTGQNPSRPTAATPFEERETENTSKDSLAGKRDNASQDEVWGNKKRFEVIVDDEEEIIEEKLPMAMVKPIVEPSYSEEVEEEELLEDEFEEIKPIIIKNSNLHPILDIKEDEPEEVEEVQIEIKHEPVMKEKVEVVTPLTETKKKGLNWQKIGWWTMIFSWIFLIGWAGLWGISTYKMFGKAGKLKELIVQKKYNEAEKLIIKTTTEVRQREIEVEDWGLNRWIWGRRYQTVLKVLEQGMIVGGEAVSLAKRSETINNAIFSDKEIVWKDEITGIKNDLSESESDLGVLLARLSGDWSWVPPRWKGNLTDFKKQLEEVKELISLGNKAVDVLPEVLATDGKRREYMVLLQNENELRPSGGFVGSYGILSFEGGGLSNFEIKDIYEADGQLKGHVEPPDPIKRYLGEAAWFMRDANWQADFGAAGKDIQWFLEKETGRKVDGVIGVNLAVAKAILGVVGEVYVPDFKEKINKNNLYEQAEFYSETKFFPGSNQKASFLGGLGKQLFEEIKDMKSDKRMEMLAAIIDLLGKNEILISLNNKQAAATVAELGWNGAIYEGKCSIDRCFADYLYVVEANLGVNKANYFLYRSIDQTVDISNQSIGRVVKITYENTAKNSNWPGGDYKNYMRVYIPDSSNLAGVSVADGGGVKTNITGDSLVIKKIKGKKEIGFMVTVPATGKRIVEIRYVDQIDLRNKDKFSYLHFVQKQSGYGDTGLVSLISMPDGWQPTQVEPTATIVNGKLLFNQKLDGNIKMGVEISK
jgi:hypothetical protein